MMKTGLIIFQAATYGAHAVQIGAANGGSVELTTKNSDSDVAIGKLDLTPTEDGFWTTRRKIIAAGAAAIVLTIAIVPA
eukprot:gene412-697_t